MRNIVQRLSCEISLDAPPEVPRAESVSSLLIGSPPRRRSWTPSASASGLLRGKRQGLGEIASPLFADCEGVFARVGLIAEHVLLSAAQSKWMLGSASPVLCANVGRATNATWPGAAVAAAARLASSQVGRLRLQFQPEAH